MTSTTIRMLLRARTPCTRAVSRAAPARLSVSSNTSIRSFHYARSLRADEAAKQEETAAKTEEEAGKQAEAATDGKKEETKDWEMLLAEKDVIIQEGKDKLLRTLADMQNLRDRVARESENSRKYAITKFGKDILDVSDTLEMALKQADGDLKHGDNPHLKAFHDGILMTEKTLLKVFETHGIQRFEAMGEKFDPNKHDGLYEFEDPTKTPGTVGAILKSGYTIKDKLLRPAQVGTVKAPSKPPADS